MKHTPQTIPRREPMIKSHRLSKITRMHSTSNLAKELLSNQKDTKWVVLQVEYIGSTQYDLIVEYVDEKHYMTEEGANECR
jgi:hypothetical protein